MAFLLSSIELRHKIISTDKLPILKSSDGILFTKRDIHNTRCSTSDVHINEVSQCNIDKDETATKDGNSFHMKWVGYIPFHRLQPFPQLD